mgnify:CR=1 FL=1
MGRRKNRGFPEGESGMVDHAPRARQGQITARWNSGGMWKAGAWQGRSLLLLLRSTVGIPKRLHPLPTKVGRTKSYRRGSSSGGSNGGTTIGSRSCCSSKTCISTCPATLLPLSYDTTVVCAPAPLNPEWVSFLPMNQLGQINHQREIIP